MSSRPQSRRRGTDQAFCAGADLVFLRQLHSAGDVAGILDTFLKPLTALLRALRAAPKPVNAAINGHCAAGGLELALCCDLIVAADTARIADAHARYGLVPAIGGAHTLARTLGPFRAKELLFMAEALSGQEMAAAGLANRAVPPDKLHDCVAEIVATLAERSPLGLHRMKQMVNDSVDMLWDMAARYEFALAEGHIGTDVPIEGLAAFVERRKPRF